MRKIRLINQILPGGQSLQDSRGRCVVVGDKDQEWDTKGILYVINVKTLLFTDDAKLTTRPLAEVTLQVLQLVG